jgi:cell wall-associated NlpC family hydrolase
MGAQASLRLRRSTGVKRAATLTLLLLVVGLGTAGCLGAAPPTTGAAPPPVAGAALAVAYAESQIGMPYCVGGTGPTCFDCSGLTSKAWQAGGLTIPRTSGDQFAAYPQVALNQIQPGDLVFPADPTQHVGIYVGGGMVVHATHTGDFVREVALSDPYLGWTYAVRPG